MPPKSIAQSLFFSPGLTPPGHTLAQSVGGAFVQTDADNEPIAGLIEDLHNTPISDVTSTIDVTDTSRNTWAGGFTTRQATDFERVQVHNASQDMLVNLAQDMRDLDLLAHAEGFDNLQNPSSRNEQLVGVVATILKDHPSVMIDLPQRQLFGMPSREELLEAAKNLRAADKNLREAAEELYVTRKQLAETQQALQEARQQPELIDQDVQTIASNLGKTHSAIQALIFSTMGEDVHFDWDAMENIWSQAFTQAREYTAGDVRSSSQWLARFNNLSDAVSNTHSVRELAATILASAFTTDFTLSMDYLHALAKQMEPCSPEQLHLPLALLQSYLKCKRDRIMLNGVQVSVNRALIMLRGIELFCDHVIRIRHLGEVDKLFEDVQPFLQQACSQSTVVRALTKFITQRLNNTPESSIACILVAEAAQISMTNNNRTCFMDMGNFITIEDSTINIVWPNEVVVDLAVGHGWSIRVGNEHISWTSSNFRLDKESFDELQRVVPDLMNRRLSKNETITLSDAKRLLQDY